MWLCLLLYTLYCRVCPEYKYAVMETEWGISCFLIVQQRGVMARCCPTCHHRPSGALPSCPAATRRASPNSTGETVSVDFWLWPIFYPLSLQFVLILCGSNLIVRREYLLESDGSLTSWIWCLSWSFSKEEAPLFYPNIRGVNKLEGWDRFNLNQNDFHHLGGGRTFCCCLNVLGSTQRSPPTVALSNQILGKSLLLCEW